MTVVQFPVHPPSEGEQRPRQPDHPPKKGLGTIAIVLILPRLSCEGEHQLQQPDQPPKKGYPRIAVMQLLLHPPSEEEVVVCGG
jgi:hypothetical protein